MPVWNVQFPIFYCFALSEEFILALFCIYLHVSSFFFIVSCAVTILLLLPDDQLLSHGSPFSNPIRPSCLPWALPGSRRQLSTMDPALRTTPDPLHYPCTHGARPPVTPASCRTWCSAEACNGRECRQRRKPRQPGEQKSYARWALRDSLLILEGLPSSRRAMALLGDAVCCARDWVRSLFLGVTWVRWNWRGFRCK